jgi:hypothetical protein
MTNFRFSFPNGLPVSGSLLNGASSIPFSILSYGNTLPPLEPTVTFQIARIDPVSNDHLVVPVTLGFTPVNIQGFEGVDGDPIVEPTEDTNVYDPTSLEIFWFWSYDEPIYTPRTPEVRPAHMRDLNKGFSKTDWHNFHAPGARTVSLFAYDTKGNWGTATYVFGPDGQAPAFVGPDDYFAAADTAYYSPTGIFPPDLPAGTSTFTTQNPLNQWIAARTTITTGFVRVRFRRGETYSAGHVGEGRNCYMDAYGDPADPPPNHLGHLLDGAGRIIEQDFIGEYDATTETGRRREILLTTNSKNAGYLMLHRCKLSGGDSITITTNSGTRTRVFSDVEVTNWQNYGIFGSAMNLVMLGCDVHQPEGALSGTDHGGGSQTFARLTNAHGPVRAGAQRNLHIACSSFFSRNGWSVNAYAGRWNTVASTTAQAAFRWMINLRTNRNYNNFDRCIFEGGSEGINTTRGSDGMNRNNSAANTLIQNCLFVSSRHTEAPLINGVAELGPGAAFRNNFFYIPEVGVAPGTNRMRFLIHWWDEGDVNPPNPSRVFCHNNTAWVRADNAALGGSTTRTLATIGALFNPIIENNLYYGPSLSPAIGTGLEPFDTPNIATYQTRFRGQRFNFPPVNHFVLGPEVTASSVRVGGEGTVEPGDWIEVPYPDYTGRCNGALPRQVTRADCESALPAEFGGGVRYHQISIHDVWQVVAAAPAAAGGNGRVAFEFTDTHIRVQNLSTVSWTGKFWILLDLREHLMDFVAGSGNPLTIQWLVPGALSTARPASPTGLFARTDMTGALRETAVQGALIASPV